MLEADRKEESVEDMTAADTAPSPMKDTATGVMWKYTRGSVRLRSSSCRLAWPYVVWFQSKTEQAQVHSHTFCSMQFSLQMVTLLECKLFQDAGIASCDVLRLVGGLCSCRVEESR